MEKRKNWRKKWKKEKTFFLKENLLQDPDSMRTGTKGRPVLVQGIFMGVERAGRLPIAEPISTESMSIEVNEFLWKKVSNLIRISKSFSESTKK